MNIYPAEVERALLATGLLSDAVAVGIPSAVTGQNVGAAVVAPAAEIWAGELTLAVRAGVTTDLLADLVHAYPAWSESVHPAALDLIRVLDRGRR